MGLKADNAQLGQSATASQNFNLRAPLDGTLRLSRGNAGSEISDPIKVETNNDVTLLGNVLSGVYGTGQTLQGFTVGAQRVGGTVYTNTSGKPITINVIGTCANLASFLVCTLNGLFFFGSAAYASPGWCSVTCVVPAGATYSVGANSGGYTLSQWSELR